MKIILVTVFAFLVFAQCPSQNSDKELELREKELALKEKELELKEKEKEDKEDEEKEAKEKPAAPAPKKSEPPAAKQSTASKGCSLSNIVQFKKGTSAQTYKCELDTNSGNTKHRYKLDAEAGQDLTINFKSNDASYSFVAPNGFRKDNITSREEIVALQVDGTWIISVVLDSGSSFGDYTINFKIK